MAFRVVAVVVLLLAAASPVVGRPNDYSELDLMTGEELFQRGVALREAGNFEEAVQPLWRAGQKGREGAMSAMKQCYVDMGEPWRFWHSIAQVAGAQVRENPGDENARAQMLQFYESAIGDGAPRSVVDEYAFVSALVSDTPDDAATQRAKEANKLQELGTSLFGIRRWSAALEALTKASELDPTSVSLAGQRAFLKAKTMSWALKQHDTETDAAGCLFSEDYAAETLTSAEEAWARELAETGLMIEGELEQIEAVFELDEKTAKLPAPGVYPAMSIYLPCFSPELKLRMAQAYARAESAIFRGVLGQELVYDHAIVVERWRMRPTRRVRVGLVATRLQNSALALLLVDVVSRLATSPHVELHVFSLGKGCAEDAETKTDCALCPRRQKMKLAVESAGGTWTEMQEVFARQALQTMRRAELDVVVDLDGYSNNGVRRGELFSLRVAPVQIHVQDYMSTAGVPNMDWLWADDVVVPRSHATGGTQCSERLVYSKPSFFLGSHSGLYDFEEVNNTSGAWAFMMDVEEQDSRQRERLPVVQGWLNDAASEKIDMLPSDLLKEQDLKLRPFVYASFNKMEKMSPRVIRSWARILVATRRGPGSVLWVLKFPADGEEGFRRAIRDACEALLLDEAQQCSSEIKEKITKAALAISEERVIVGDFVMTDAENMARLKLADVILDTWPYGAHTGGLDALWSGIPLLTRTDGDSMASRVALSQLVALSLDREANAALQPPPMQSYDEDEDEHASEFGRSLKRDFDVVGALGADGERAYVDMAVAHASEREKTHKRAAELVRSRRDTSPLFNADDNTANLANALRSIWGEYLQEGDKPAEDRAAYIYTYGPDADRLLQWTNEAA